MIFSLKIPIPKASQIIDYQSEVLLLGSCFSKNIGNKFNYFKFTALVNPFGIIFNAVSLEKLVKRAVSQNYFTENDIFFHNELWHCFEVHSELSNPDKEKLLKDLNCIIELTNQQITKLTHCIITLGTSWVYRLRQAQSDNQSIVANCHKVPQKEFTKELLSAEQNEQSLKNIISLIQSINPNCKFIFTVSPVRHIKDGSFENNVSKGNLFSALHNVLESEYCKLNTEYFPSYEIVMDELRDYRFYEKDMLHPNNLAVDYIWERFSETYFDSNTLAVMNEVEMIQKGLSHRPFNPNTESHQRFLEQLQLKIESLKAKCSTIEF